MCGIAGIVTSSQIDLHSKISKMKSCLYHRGPDSQNIHVNYEKNFGFASTRLAILDTNEKSNQPFKSYNNNIICYNGEIYNYREIRSLLIEKNVNLRTNSDTEIILEGYNLFGTEILQHLNGMFSFVIWDDTKNIFFGARDRLGIKPLIYYKDEKQFVFSSELRPIVKTFPELKSINYQSLLESSVYGIVHQPNTIFQDIKFLEPGTYFLLDLKNNLQISKYWDIEKKIKKKIYFKNENEYYESVFEKINRSVEKSIVSDVEIGSFLSGGVDSGIVTHIASKLIKKKINAFNLIFEKKKDIFKIEKYQNKKLINFHKKKIDTSEIFENFSSFIEALDQPSYDGFNTFLVSKEAAQHTKVSLSGLGADEIFFGYSVVSNFINSRNKSLINKIKSILYYFKKHSLLESGYFSNVTIENFFVNLRKISNFDPRQIFTDEINKSINFEYLNSSVLRYDNKKNNFVDRVFLFDIQNYLKNTLLRDSDNMSMKHSLELRPSFLDHELVEFCGATNLYSVSKSSIPKFQLKKFYKKCYGYSPPRQKLGFNVPIANLISNFLKNDITIELKLSENPFSYKYKNFLLSKLNDVNFNTEVLNFFIISKWLKFLY